MWTLLALAPVSLPFSAVTPMAGKRTGFTFIEIVVTLLVLVVVATLAAPAIGHLPERGSGTLSTLVQEARTQAVRRADALDLTVDSSGAWVLARARNGVVIGHGVVGKLHEPVALHISALGLCLVSREDAHSAAVPWDALRCAPGSPKSGVTDSSQRSSRERGPRTLGLAR
jgi:prepilin-type N-terminal cleavage/methylation domain-containing protein